MYCQTYLRLHRDDDPTRKLRIAPGMKPFSFLIGSVLGATMRSKHQTRFITKKLHKLSGRLSILFGDVSAVDHLKLKIKQLMSHDQFVKQPEMN